MLTEKQRGQGHYQKCLKSPKLSKAWEPKTKMAVPKEQVS